MTSKGTGPGSAYSELLEHTRETALLGSTAGLLGWDQEVLMPAEGLEHRSRQLAQLARLAHGMATDPRVGELLDRCEDDPDVVGDPAGPAAANVREIRRAFTRATCLPASLVEELARTRSRAQHAWAEARAASDFPRFRPWLETMVGLARQVARCHGWAKGGEPWDALAEDYEPGATAASVAAVFGPLRERLQALVAEILGASRRPADAFRAVRVPVDRQERLSRAVAGALGFDFARGRLDVSTHPFTNGVAPTDVRMTTRFREDDVLDALGSTMHETGHALYEQGLPSEHAGTPLGEAVSLGIHESQSRLWENQVGRSRAFWSWCQPLLAEHLGPEAGRFSSDALFGTANLVEPSFIRVEADEATYNLHVMVRFEVERALLAGDLAAADVPGAWNERYRALLGVDVPDDRRGCLQDIHWSMGLIGYFPTYTLGNLYAAQLWEAASRDLPDLEGGIAQGRFGDLLAWLREKVHVHGMRWRAAELCERATGAPLSAEPLLRHLEGKLRPLYGI